MNRTKNIVPRWAAICLILAAITGCSKNSISPSGSLDDGLDPSSGRPIAFEAEDAFTKAAVSDVADIQNDANGFRVWSWFEGTTAGPMFGETGTQVTYSDGNWTYSPTRYWINGNYDFAAIYPAAITTGEGDAATTTLVNGTYAPASAGGTPVLTVPDFDVTSQTDLLVAFNNGEDGNGIDGSLGNSNNPVELSFQHALSNVQLKLTLKPEDFYELETDEDDNPIYDNNGKPIIIRQVGYAYVSIIGFNNIATVGTMNATNYGEASWTNKEQTGSLRLNYTESPLQITLDNNNFLGEDGMFVIPQELLNSSGELYMQVIIYPLGATSDSITKEFYVPLKSGVPEWEPNTKYIYTGVITQELVIDFSITVVNAWEDESLGDIIVS